MFNFTKSYSYFFLDYFSIYLFSEPIHLIFKSYAHYGIYIGSIYPN